LTIIGMIVLWLIAFGWPADTVYARISLTDLQNQIGELQGQVDDLEGSRISDNKADFQTQIDELIDNICSGFYANGLTPPDQLGCTPPSNTIFVTSTTHNGNLGGLAGADAICAARAAAAGLPGVFKAWLSDANVSTENRLSHSVAPYVNVAGEWIASNWDDLTDNDLRSPINMDENGNIIDVAGGAEDEAWTYTYWNGQAANIVDPGYDDRYACSSWTSIDFDGISGTTSANHSGWTWWNIRDCSNELRLYCVEQ